MSSYARSVIRTAINEKTAITARYKDDAEDRVLSPHALGIKGSDPHTLWRVLCVQTSGASSSGLEADATKNWRCLFLSELRSVSPSGRPWETADNHSRPQWCIDEIDTEVDY